MPKRTILLVSPREPSGATWLINCLLELGIQTYRYSPQGMWRREQGRWLLNAHEHVLRKWLPALVDHQSFRFRDDVAVRWMHEWFSKPHADCQVLYFVRDPRDALYSRYKREAPGLSYKEFIAFPDVSTLLDKVANWWLYNNTWLAHPNLSVFRFEDYKADAERTLASVLQALRLPVSDADIVRATQCSTFERAAAAERAYRAQNREDTQLINRSGRAMEWQTGEADRSVVAHIERGCADLLNRYGYAGHGTAAAPANIHSHVRRLAFFGRVEGMEAALSAAPRRPEAEGDGPEAVGTFIASLSPELLQRAGLPDHELRQLQSSLQEYLGALGAELDACFARAAPGMAASDRDPLPLARLRSGVSRRLRRLLGMGS